MQTSELQSFFSLRIYESQTYSLFLKRLLKGFLKKVFDLNYMQSNKDRGVNKSETKSKKSPI